MLQAITDGDTTSINGTLVSVRHDVENVRLKNRFNMWHYLNIFDLQ